ncbi:formyltetrahydrofolate synthetase [Eggerthella sp. YY7918]|nr:formyltetrahydrofolate synthetase [Eggerthella sp. YY7918]
MEAKDAKLVLTAALRKMNANTGRKTTLDKAIDSLSSYPAREAIARRDPSAKYSEGLAVAIEMAYNGEAKNKTFARYILDELKGRLSE